MTRVCANFLIDHGDRKSMKEKNTEEKSTKREKNGERNKYREKCVCLKVKDTEIEAVFLTGNRKHCEMSHLKYLFENQRNFFHTRLCSSYILLVFLMTAFISLVVLVSFFFIKRIGGKKTPKVIEVSKYVQNTYTHTHSYP